MRYCEPYKITYFNMLEVIFFNKLRIYIYPNFKC